MTDQCKHCIFRGDLKACQAAECHKHDDWYSVQLNKRIAELEEYADEMIAEAEKADRRIVELESAIRVLLSNSSFVVNFPTECEMLESSLSGGEL